MRFPVRFLTDQEQAAIAIALTDFINHNPKQKGDPTIASLVRKFNVEPLLAGIDARVKDLIGSVLSDLDAGLTADRIAQARNLPVSAVEELKTLHERNRQ